MSKKRELHQSDLLDFLKCAKASDFRRNKRITVPKNFRLTVGGAVHSAIKANLRQKITSGIDLPKEAMLDAYSSEFEARSPETEWQGEKKGAQKDLGAKLVELHREKLSPFISPLKVEEKFVLETDAGYDIGGTIDLIETDGTIVDSKTANKKYEETAISRAIQPALYDFAYEALNGKKAAGFRYDVLVKSATPTVQQVRGEVTLDDRSWMINAANSVFKAMEAGVATPAPELPGVWWCSEKFCDFWKMCKGKNRLKPVPVEGNRMIDGIFPVKRSNNK